MPNPEPTLMDLMSDLQTCLRRGDLAGLSALTAAIVAAEPQLHVAKAEELLRLRKLAEQNARSLTAARRGVLAARRRIAEVLAAARGLVTYDRKGQRVEESDQRLLARRL